MKEELGAPKGTGSRASTEPQSPQGLGPTGFDPSRWLETYATPGKRTYSPELMYALASHPTDRPWRACVYVSGTLWRKMLSRDLVRGTCCASHLTAYGRSVHDALANAMR